MTPADAGARAHAFVDDLASPLLRDGDRHHLTRVLRVRDGDEITVGDGAGRWCTARMGDTLAVTGDVHTASAPDPPITVALALVKGQRPELAVQKLTEVGADRIVLFAAARSVVRWDDGRAGRGEVRLAEVARAAAMQSRRAHLPTLEVGAAFAEVAALDGACLAERGGQPPSLRRATVLIGPEGGWAPEELAAGLPRVALAATVLRSETAAIAAGTILATLRSGLVGETPTLAT